MGVIAGIMAFGYLLAGDGKGVLLALILLSVAK